MTRAHETTTKIRTPFDNMFIHWTWDGDKAVGFSISHKQKDLDSQVSLLIETLSRGIHSALKEGP